MSTYIVNTVNPIQTELISYGWDLVLKEVFEGGDVMPFRMKLGAEISNTETGEIYGRVETDAFGENIEYSISIGDILRGYVTPGEPTLNVLGVDNITTITIKPYKKFRELTGSWATYAYPANEKDFVLQRGVHNDYYTIGDYTPKTPKGDFSELMGDVVNTRTMPADAVGWMYHYLFADSSGYYRATIHRNTYALDATGNEYLVSSTAPIAYDLRDTDDIFLSIMIGNQNQTIYGSITRAEIIVKTEGMTLPEDTVVSTNNAVINVKYTCPNDYVFKVDLLFLDNEFLWQSIPFHMKNGVVNKRNTTTIERYDRSKHDILNNVRTTYTLKSDWLDRASAESFMLYGMSTGYKMIGTSNTGFNPRDVRLTSGATMIKHPTNEGMVQLECTIERSELTLIA